jgi:chorismate--pyruvate lyase
LIHRTPHSVVLEPEWGEWRRQRIREIPSDIQTWLRDQGSLTKRVIQACGEGAFRVRLLHQGWGKPLNSESSLMQTRRGVITLVREVELLCDEHPWVFARTLIPATSLQRSVRRLTQLGEKPLGAVLFSDPNVHRGTTQIARLTPRHQLFDVACANLQSRPDSLWARRTLFYIAGRPLLVNEIFLPDIPLKETRG